MPVLAPAGSTPFVHPINLGTPLVAPIPPPGQMMPVGIAPSPSSAPMPPMPVFMTGGGTMPMTSPAALPGNFVQTPMALPPPMPNAMAPPSPSFGVLAGVLPQILKFGAHGPYAGLLYHSPHTVLHEGELYPTALHLFEARKFLDHRPGLARRIRQCERVEMVTAISEELRAFTRPDWANVALVIMDEALYRKFRQHRDLRDLLLNTYPYELVYVEPTDAYWGNGAGAGRNEFGKSLVRVRDRLRGEVGM